MSKRPSRTGLAKYPDGTTRASAFPKGTPMGRFSDTEPIFDIWRDPAGNVIERPDPERYPEMWPPEWRDMPGIDKESAQKRAQEWVRSAEGKEHRRRRTEKKRRDLGLSPEEYKRYNEALREYHDNLLWGTGPAPKPQPEDFRGTSP